MKRLFSPVFAFVFAFLFVTFTFGSVSSQTSIPRGPNLVSKQPYELIFGDVPVAFYGPRLDYGFPSHFLILGTGYKSYFYTSDKGKLVSWCAKLDTAKLVVNILFTLFITFLVVDMISARKNRLNHVKVTCLEKDKQTQTLPEWEGHFFKP